MKSFSGKMKIVKEPVICCDNNLIEIKSAKNSECDKKSHRK